MQVGNRVVAIIKKDNITVGMRVRDEYGKVDILSIESMKREISQHRFDNVEWKEDRIRGTESSLDRVPIYNNGKLTGSYDRFILFGEKYKGDIVCYVLMDSFGRTKKYSAKDVLDMAKKNKISNAKVCKNGNGKEYIQGIKTELCIRERRQPVGLRNKNEGKEKCGQMRLDCVQSNNRGNSNKIKKKREEVAKLKDNRDMQRMKELVPYLEECARVYEQEDRELISNFEYDKLYDELKALEEKTGIVLAGSVTHKVGFEVMSKLPKVTHPKKMLSLDKTKDVERLKSFLGDQEGMLSWKLDGCFTERAKVEMWDGGYKRIVDIQVGDYVKSLNVETGLIEKKEVTNVFYNGRKKAEEWVGLGIGSKSDRDIIQVTKNHLFYTNKGWVEAGNINIGDKVIARGKVLSESQISFIVGMAMGDGSILKRSKEDTEAVQLSYSKSCENANMEYIRKFENLFSSYLGSSREYTSGYGSNMYVRYLRVINSLPKELVKRENIVKTSMRFTGETLSYLSPLSLAIFFIDDGYRGQSKDSGDNVKNKRSRAHIAVYRYDLEDIQRLSNYLVDKYGIENSIRKDKLLSDGKPGYVIDMTADGSDKFFDIIAPYIPLELRSQKLPKVDRWQNADVIEWWEDKETEGTIELEVYRKTVPKHRPYYKAYDIEVEDNHNYIVKGCVVHNCTVVATYEDGKIIEAVTRGNGEVGEGITPNYKQFSNVPLHIEEKGRVVIRGEAVIDYATFEDINSKVVGEKYKNARNLASGSVRQLDSKITKERKVRFIGFAVVEGLNDLKTKSDKLDRLDQLGFETVERVLVTKDTVADAVDNFSKKVQRYEIPCDGLVMVFDDVEYSLSLGETSKFPKDGLAFKWKDEVAKTTLKEVEWSTSRTGAINPIAVFEPVELEGTTVERASVHNLSILKELRLGVGDEITVFKANMIIPQVAENLTKSGNLVIPKVCPVCGYPTEIVKEKETEVLMCNNLNCHAQIVRGLSHFVSRNAMNIDGMSVATLDLFVQKGFIDTAYDIYELAWYQNEIVSLDGWGERAFKKLMASIEKSKDVELPNFINALGIPGVGLSTAKDICKHFGYDFDEIVDAEYEDFLQIDGIGGTIANNLNEYFRQVTTNSLAISLSRKMRFKKPQRVDESSPIAGKKFVVTGDVEIFKNRKELQAFIESKGGINVSSVSKETDYLLCNESGGTSGKWKKFNDVNAKAKTDAERVEHITEKQFMEWFK